MNSLRTAAITLLLWSMSAMAEPATESSIKEMLAVTQSQKLVDGMRAQMDSGMENAIRQSLHGRSPTPKQQQAIDRMKARMIAIAQEELAWEKLEPMYIRLFKESFSEEEVASMLAFYKTPGGQAIIYKMPILMQKTMQEVQKMILGMTPKMQKVQEQFVSEMSSANE